MKKYIIIIVSVTVFLTSCSDWLTLAPEDGVTLQEFWKTKEQVNSAVVGCYASLLDGPVNKMFLWGELRADLIDNGVNYNSQYAAVIDGEISAENTVVDWSALYSVINNCNIVLKFAPNVRKVDGTFTEKQLKQYESEVLTLRAMMYFQLVRAFRDVPLTLEAYVADNQDLYLPKTPAEVILDTLVCDLKIAVANAPITYGNVQKDKYHITAFAARALLADIYLWQEKYAECSAVCQEIIASGRYSMLPVERNQIPVTVGGLVVDTVFVPNESDADQMFINTYVKGASVESIFEIPFTTEKTNVFYGMLGPSVNQLKPKADIIDGVVFPEAIYSFQSDASDIRGSGCSFRNGLVWKYVGTSRTGSARTATDYTSPWIVYKYSDVLLMQAEAMNQIGIKLSNEGSQDYYASAISNMKIVRDARNAVMTDAYKFNSDNIDGKALESAILAERAREFAFEGKRWYDVLRYAKRDNYGGNNLNYLFDLARNSASPLKQQSLIAKYKDPKHNSHYWPIYIKEIETNNNIQQNEFYAK